MKQDVLNAALDTISQKEFVGIADGCANHALLMPFAIIARWATSTSMANALNAKITIANHVRLT